MWDLIVLIPDLCLSVYFMLSKLFTHFEMLIVSQAPHL